ncbi:MAG: hypothetical protein M1828_006095 [Chrysothrix sp. TS-e1954]|nr:MAG: hypothetical protein M1828_006095 [Chrysothrix sp. TS-e1954]
MSSQLSDNLLITFVAIILVAITCCGILYILSRYRRSLGPNGKPILPLHNKQTLTTPTTRSRHSRQSSVVLTARPQKGQRRFTRPLSIFTEKAEAVKDANSNSPPASPLPEIRVTLPEEMGTDGEKKVPRVVIVHLNEKGEAMGMEPVTEDLPPYKRFESVDLERVGGLKEKDEVN